MTQRRPNKPRSVRPGGMNVPHKASPSRRSYASPSRISTARTPRTATPSTAANQYLKSAEQNSGTGFTQRKKTQKSLGSQRKFKVLKKVRGAAGRRIRYIKEGTTLSYGTGDVTRTISLRAIAVLAFVALAVVMVASPLKNYLAQQEEKRELIAQLEDSRSHIDQLEQEVALWKDPVFVQSQARKRLGYVMPGQTLYLLDDGALGEEELSPRDLAERALDERRAATPFYMTAWDSIVVSSQASEFMNNPEQVPVLNVPQESGASPNAEQEKSSHSQREHK